jgi:hypothetical protein
METAIPPELKQGEKIHHPIFHDECCVHANDQCSHVWMREGEQPLRDKGRGRIVHISDFIIEHSGRLVLPESLQEEQLKLPKQPAPPAPATTSADAPDTVTTASTSAVSTPVPASTDGITSTTKGKGRVSRRKAPAQPKPKPADRRTLDQTNVWIPPPPPAPFTSYQLPNFDARQIIYPGANHDPWWDMPQLIAQVDVYFRVCDSVADVYSLD